MTAGTGLSNPQIYTILKRDILNQKGLRGLSNLQIYTILKPVSYFGSIPEV